MMPAAVCICVGKFVYKNKSGLYFYGFIKVKLFHRSSIMFGMERRKQFQTIQPGPGLRMSIGLNVTYRNICTMLFFHMGSIQHCICLSHACRIAEKNLQMPPFRRGHLIGCCCHICTLILFFHTITPRYFIQAL